MLIRNVEENRLQPVTCINEAVSGARGRMPFSVHPTDPGGHSLGTRPEFGTVIEVQFPVAAAVRDAVRAFATHFDAIIDHR